MTVGDLKKAIESFNDREPLFVQCNADGQVGVPLASIEFVQEISAIVLFPDWERFFKEKARRRLKEVPR